MLVLRSVYCDTLCVWLLSREKVETVFSDGALFIQMCGRPEKVFHSFPHSISVMFFLFRHSHSERERGGSKIDHTLLSLPGGSSTFNLQPHVHNPTLEQGGACWYWIRIVHASMREWIQTYFPSFIALSGVSCGVTFTHFRLSFA